MYDIFRGTDATAYCSEAASADQEAGGLTERAAPRFAFTQRQRTLIVYATRGVSADLEREHVPRGQTGLPLAARSRSSARPTAAQRPVVERIRETLLAGRGSRDIRTSQFGAAPSLRW